LVLLLSFSIEIFQIHISIHVFGNNSQFVRVVLGLAKIVSIGSDDVGVVLNFHELNCFFLVLIELVEVFGFDFLESINLPCG
jgi:chitinase